MPLRKKDDLSRVSDTYPVVTFEKSANTQYPNEYKECKWKAIGINDLKEIKQARIPHGMCSEFVR